jgi:hypothetical protein
LMLSLLSLINRVISISDVLKAKIISKFHKN